MPMSMDFSAATGSIISPLSPPHPLSAPPIQHSFLPPSPSLIGSAPTKSSGGSTTNSVTTATAPVHTRARTTSSNSTSTISATRYQIATSMLQPSEPPLMDIAQPTLRSPTSGASLGEPSLSTIAAAAAAAASPSSTGPSLTAETLSTAPGMAESNKMLVSKLLSLANTFTGSIRALCEQQNEKVLRFDDDMILELLTRWEQEAGREEEEESVSDADDGSSTTSFVTLGATNALERYQIIVGRVWEETDVILSCIRKIRDLVEFGRVQNYSDFDADDSEEDAIEKDELIKKSLYSRLLFHANGLVTVLGEFLECVSGIQQLVSTIKTQRKSQEGNHDELYHNNGSPVDNSASVVDFIADDPIPVKHLDPALMRKLKRKNRFKTMTEKVRRSFTDFAKRSTTSLLAVFPPLGDGTNEGFNWDSYSDGEYFSEEWVGTEYGSSYVADEDSFARSLSPPDSPGIRSEKFYGRHRRLSSKDSSGLPDQYWPGSTRLGFSDDGMSPTTSVHPTSPFSTSSSSIPIASSSPGGGFVGGTSMAMSRSMDSEHTVNTIATRLHMDSPNNVASPTRKSLESLGESTELTGHSSKGTGAVAMASSLQPTSPTQTGAKEKRHSLLFRRKSIQAPTFTGVSISAPLPIASRPYSIYSSSGESQTPSRNNYRARPPRPPNSLPPMPPSPNPEASSRGETFENSIGYDSSIFKPKSTHRCSSYLASRSISPLQSSPLILDSPFTRQTSIRMGNDRNRYSVKMPEDEQWDHQLSRSNTISSTNGSSSNGSNNSPRSSRGNFPGSFWRRRSYNDALEKGWQSMRQESPVWSSGGAIDTSSPSTPNGRDFRSTFGLESSSSQASVRVTSFEFMIPFFSRDGNAASSSTAPSRQESRPGLGSALSQADALSRRQSVSSQKSQSTTNSQPHQEQQPQQQVSSNRNSFHMMPTVDENSKPKSAPHSAPHPRQNQDQDQIEATEAQIQAQAPRPNAPASATGPVMFMESDTLSIKPRPPRPTYKKMSSESNIHHSIAASRHNAYVATMGKATISGPHAENTSNNYREPGSLERRIPIDPARKPVIGPRFGDMKKAWEILNLDVKRLNQYSHMRAYAKGQPVQNNNNWALNHPNAHQSTTSPRVLHICENGTDVLVMEMFEGHLQVVAGLLEKLIERLADENAQDAEYVSCFLLSHSFFIDSEDLLDRLIARFHIQPRQGEILYFEKWQTVIQVKILCVLMRWILIQYEDFELNVNLLKTLRKFLEVDVRQAGFVMEAECIEKNISIKSLSPIKNCSVIMEQGRFCLQRSRTRKISLSRSQNPPLPGQLSNPASSALDPVPQSPLEQMIEYGPTPELAPSSPILQLNGQDLARYLTLADMKAFRSITVFELMSGWWKRRQAADNKQSRRNGGVDEEDEPKSPSGLSVVDIDGAEDGAIEAFTRRANMLSYWVAHEIVSTAGSKTRKQLIKKFIEVAKICRQLNNLHTSMFIVSALTSKPVRRLNSSWKLVSSKDMETLKNLEALMDPSGNMRCYRQAVAEAEAPTIPFLPILLKDITFILDGNPTMIASKANLSPQAQPDPTSASIPTSGSTTPISATSPSTTTPTPPKSNNTGAPLNAVDMAKSVDYSFEHQLICQARVFRPSSPSLYGETESMNGNGGLSLLSGKSGSNHGFLNGSSNGGGPAPDSSKGALDHISEIVERRLVKASGLYGVHQRVIQVEFINRAHGPKSNGLWKSSGGDGVSNNGSIHGSLVGSGVGSGVGSDMVIRAVQGEEEYLMGLSRMCEPARW
ncbi:hypothetical protein BGZ89_007599 [Linnemannia elongata]|nr:hypothetical protein BGZ89_007599 [Linnemannia elongata]